MNHVFRKAARFAWRTVRNLLCTTDWGRGRLFPAQELAGRFGRDDAGYAIRVFVHHYRQLSAAGFTAADKIMEVGPGRNIGTSLLMWALNYSRTGRPVTVILWDVFPNMAVEDDCLKNAADALLQNATESGLLDTVPHDRLDKILHMVSRREVVPDIRYRIQPLPQLIAAGEAQDVAMVYSHAAIEHIWNIAEFWSAVIGLTGPGGWHSHRIDLADHGRRETNYIEMLEWSPVSYWMTMRFIPGATNRWRASMHLDFLRERGLEIRIAKRETQDALPVSRARIARIYRALDDVDLRTTALDVVAVRTR